VLFGRNTAAYKFALAETLLSQAEYKSDLIRLEELASPFARAICRHLQHSPIQGTSSGSQFLDKCRAFNRGGISETNLIDATLQLGFVHVINAFHIVNREEVPQRFFIDERTTSGGIRLTDKFMELAHSSHKHNLPFEIEARWRLVETAWAVGLHSKLISFCEESQSATLVAEFRGRRLPVTSARAALSGYQKGKCFYCGGPIEIGGTTSSSADVDHVLPHTLMTRGIRLNLDSIWNLVLACRDCNRGPRGKSALLPDGQFMEKLSTRNNYYVSSHHPLRETIVFQTGATAQQRRVFLKDAYEEAARLLIHVWKPESRGDADI
jgi:5-methylcytosine-specific restriction endonuclease McrA